MVRMNIMMPDNLALHLKKVSNKSRYIAEALEEKIQRERSKMLRTQLANDYAAVSAEDRAVCTAWDSTTSTKGWE